jgi:hypothetical protein
MSGGEPLWRRVAGLYLSGIPADAGERLSTRARDTASAASVDDGDPAQQVLLLGEALDLVTLAQGYQSPAVPLLLRALIRTIRQLAAARVEAEAAAAAPSPEAPAAETPDTAPEAAPDDESKVDEAAAKNTGKSAETADATELSPETPLPETETATVALEKRVQETDQKLSALTTAVGQLVDILQRRPRDGAGGGVDRRTSPRIPGRNARIYVRDQLYEVVNWSKGGFQIRISETDRFSRGVFDFHFILDLPEEVIEFQGRARPVRIEQTTLAAAFASIDTAAAAKISSIADRLVAAG